MNYPDQKGFTLIEALIAFLVLSVGIVGALLFHATLLAQSGDNKARLEAISVAENWAEEERNKAYTTASSFAAAMSGLSSLSSSTSGQLNDYTLSVVSVSSPSTNVYEVEYQVSWDSGSIEFSSFFGWLDTSDLVDPTKVGDGSGEEYDNPDLPLPTGTLSELPRLELVSGSITALAGQRNDSVVVYADGGCTPGAEGCDIRVAVEVADGKYVQLAELTSQDNEIFTITGRIYLNNFYGYPTSINPSGDYEYRLTRSFGPAYGVDNPSDLDLPTSSSTDYYYDSENGKYYQNNIIDIRASAGANCLVTRYENASVALEESIRGVTYQLYPGNWGDFLCVAGTGWNGTIKPYFRNYDGDSLTDIVIGDRNCAPSVRAFRYLIIESERPDELKLQFENVSDFSTSISNILATTSSSIKGQSGLVRFYNGDSSTPATSESVLWDQYFWQNPNYLLDPSHQSGASFAYTSTVEGPILLSAEATQGYKAPKVRAVSSPGYEVAYPGDVTHQNFFISGSGSGSDSLDDCGEVLVNMIPKVASYNQDQVSAADGEFTKHSHLHGQGVPGFEAAGGYIPPVDGRSLSVSDFNREVVSGEPDNTGVLILGYTLATESLSGTLSFPTSVAVGSNQFVVGGGPSPIISINCTKDTSAAVVSGAFTYLDFSCSVPNYWVGEIFAYDSTGETEVCSGSAPEISTDYFNGVSQATPGVATYEEITSTTNGAGPSVLYYYLNEIVSGADQPDVGTSDFASLGYYLIEEEAVNFARKTNNNFPFGFPSSGCAY